MSQTYDELFQDYNKRISLGKKAVNISGKFVQKNKIVDLLEAVIKSGDRVCMEGNNQKQADFLAKSFVNVNPEIINNIHLVQSSLVLNEHIDLFRKGIANKVDFAFSGPQAKGIFEVITNRQAKVGAIHTYLELYGRYFLDLTPRVSLIVADSCDKQGNLFTGFNTEDTPIITEATKFKCGWILLLKQRKIIIIRLYLRAIPQK